MAQSKTKTNVCKAKDPNTCPYHGALNRVSQAAQVLAGDPTNQTALNDFFKAQADLRKVEELKLSEEDMIAHLSKPEIDYSFALPDMYNELFNIVNATPNQYEKAIGKLFEDLSDHKKFDFPNIGTAVLVDEQTVESVTAITFRLKGRYFQIFRWDDSWTYGVGYNSEISEVKIEEETIHVSPVILTSLISSYSYEDYKDDREKKKPSPRHNKPSTRNKKKK